MKKLIAELRVFWADLVKALKHVIHKPLDKMLAEKIDEVSALYDKYQRLLAVAPVVYTVVRSYNSENGDKVFWPWVKNVLLSEEYKYLIFSMRENVIRELAQTSDPDKMREINGQLKMLQILDAYLTRGLTQYESEQAKNKI